MAELPSGTVTFLFTDVEGSTRLFEEHPGEMQDVIARHDELVRGAVERHSGHVVKFTGDGVHGAFASAADAVDAAVATLVEIDGCVWPGGVVPRVRVGVHTGDAALRAGDYFGSEVNRAARIMSVAHGGQIVCSASTAELVRGHVELRDLGEHRLRDLFSNVHLFQVAAPGLRNEFPPLRSLDAYSSNLPVELSSFVGREADVVAVAELLAESRAVAVIGVGGVGKTRLGLRVGSEVLPNYRDGVWFCDLAPVRDENEVADAIAVAVGYVPPQGTKVGDGLPRFLEHKSLLLVLDNCEHLVRSASDFATETLLAAPGVAVLATSREALGIRGERVYPLSSLSLPLDADPDSVLASESGALFVLRAREVRGTFVVNAENAVAVRDLCVRLDGIPLAIELAAARTVAMSPAEILDRLDQQFRLLTGGSRSALERHQTLRAAIDWSYDLLDVEERRLLDHCAVFVGGFDLAAATTLAASLGMDEIEAVDRIGSLVTKSLIEGSDHGAGTRYRLLEMIRQYAAERLEATGEAPTARDPHARHYVNLTKAQFDRALTADAWDALDKLEVEAANLAAAGRWLLDNKRAPDLLELFRNLPFVDPTTLPATIVDTLGRLAAECITDPRRLSLPGGREACFMAAMRHFLDGDTAEYRRYSALGHGIPGEVSGRLLMLAASVAMFSGAVDEAIAVGGDAVECARNLNRPEELAFALAHLAVFEQFEFTGAATAHAEEGIELARESSSPIPLLYPLLAFTMAVRETRPERALIAADECIRIDRSRRRSWSGVCRTTAARIRLDAGDSSGGLRDVRDTLIHLAHSGDRAMLSAQLLFLADTIATTSPLLALQLAALHESEAIAAWQGLEYQRALGEVVQQRPDEYEAARTMTASMSYEDAIAFVLSSFDQLIQQATVPTEHA